jgi:hypothetical protein
VAERLALVRAIVGGTIAVTTAPRIGSGRDASFALIMVGLGVLLIGRHGDSGRGAALTIGLWRLRGAADRLDRRSSRAEVLDEGTRG